MAANKSLRNRHVTMTLEVVTKGKDDAMVATKPFHFPLTWLTSWEGARQARIQDFEMGVNFCNNVIEPKPG